MFIETRDPELLPDNTMLIAHDMMPMLGKDTTEDIQHETDATCWLQLPPFRNKSAEAETERGKSSSETLFYAIS